MISKALAHLLYGLPTASPERLRQYPKPPMDKRTQQRRKRNKIARKARKYNQYRNR